MIRLVNVKKYYSVAKHDDYKVKAVDGISLELGQTGLVSIVGKSGCGKTTLLNLLGGIDSPTEGSIYINDKQLNKFSTKELDSYRNYDVSFIFQDFNLMSDTTVGENIRLACRIQKRSKKTIESIVDEVLTKVGLSDMKDRKISSLSGGQQQRVAIARALAKKSSIVLCDEPTGNLDSQTSAEVFNLLKEISNERLVIVITHDGESAKEYSNRMVSLSDGHVVDDVTLSETKGLNDTLLDNNKNRSKSNSLSFWDTLVLIKDNFIKHIFVNFAVILMLICAIGLTTTFTSLSLYNQYDALLTTLRTNNQNLVQITKYIDKTPDNFDNETLGPKVYYSESKEEDMSKIQEQIGTYNDIYKSYFFSKNFQDFMDGALYSSEDTTTFYADSFREAIAVTNFKNFNLDLESGTYPTENNQVLVYDYIAKSLEYYKLIPSYDNAIGYTLKDQDTNLSFTITGIVKSNYKSYEEVMNNKDANHDFAEKYLASLQTIFVTPEFITNIKDEINYKSVFNANYNVGTEYYETEEQVKKTKFLDYKNLKNIYEDKILYVDKDNFAANSSVFLSYNQFKYLYSKTNPNDTLTDANLQNAVSITLANSGITGTYNGYGYDISKTKPTPYIYYIAGIIDDRSVPDSNKLKDNILYWTDTNEDALYTHTTVFRQFYLMLTNDWSQNKVVLQRLKMPEAQSYDFYKNNPDYYKEGYTEYIPYGVLITEANYYLAKVKDFAQIVMIILIIIALIGVFTFATITIKKFSYKIGVLKSMGVSNLSVTMVFGLQIVIITLFSYLISIPVSYGLMTYINNTFIADINRNLVFFSISGLIVFIMGIASLVAVCLSTTYPLVKLYREAPSSIIKKTNRN